MSVEIGGSASLRFWHITLSHTCVIIAYPTLFGFPPYVLNKGGGLLQTASQRTYLILPFVCVCVWSAVSYVLDAMMLTCVGQIRE